MPLYEYKCAACGHRFEIIQKFSDPPADTCPECGGAVEKLQSAPAFQFKGSGWYVTDYARKDQPSESKIEGGAPAESSAKKDGAAASETGSKDGAKDKGSKPVADKTAAPPRSSASSSDPAKTSGT